MRKNKRTLNKRLRKGGGKSDEKSKTNTTQVELPDGTIMLMDEKEAKYNLMGKKSKDAEPEPKSKTKSTSPRKKSTSPRKKSASPRKKSTSPRKKSASPRKKSTSPRKGRPLPTHRPPSRRRPSPRPAPRPSPRPAPRPALVSVMAEPIDSMRLIRDLERKQEELSEKVVELDEKLLQEKNKITIDISALRDGLGSTHFKNYWVDKNKPDKKFKENIYFMMNLLLSHLRGPEGYRYFTWEEITNYNNSIANVPIEILLEYTYNFITNLSDLAKEKINRGSDQRIIKRVSRMFYEHLQANPIKY